MNSKNRKLTVALSGCFLNFMKLGLIKSLGVFVVPIQEAFNTTMTVMGGYMALFLVAAELFAPMANLASRNFGEPMVIVVGGILSTLSMFVASWVSSVTQFGILIFLTVPYHNVTLRNLVRAYTTYN